MTGKVDISDLTWEQKEKVLRFLFAKMNGAETTTVKAQGLPTIKGQHMERQSSLTQADGSVFDVVMPL